MAFELQGLKKHIGPDLTVIAKTGGQLEAILRGNPFTDVDISRVFYTIFFLAALFVECAGLGIDPRYAQHLLDSRDVFQA